ncbi:Fcf1-domain-containing protein [Phycomyces nitens]|nr:Fcf1-domain-containing protein [Phycomyces nitens]
MRPKTQQAYKRTLHTYHVGFGLREPYQILVDGDFCKEALAHKIYIKDVMPEVMQAPTKLMATECTINELQSKGRDFTNAMIVAKRFEHRKCAHKTPVTSAACISEIIGPTNQHHYCVASQDKKLRAHLRSVPGVPLLHIKKNLVILEPMSNESKEALKQHEIEKTLPRGKEASLLKGIGRAIGVTKPEDPKEKKKGLKKKGPNPLSVKKKKKTNETGEKSKPAQKRKREEEKTVSVPPSPAATVATEEGAAGGEKKRRRRSKKKTGQKETLTNETTTANSLTE